MEQRKGGSLRDRILEERIWSLMVKLSLPAIIGMSINGINAFVDALFVGQFIGQDALAAIALAFPLTMIVNGVTSMIGIGSASLLSRAIGSQNLEIQRKSFGMMLALALIASFFLTVLGIYFAETLIAFMGGKGMVLELGTQYYTIMMAGAFFRLFAIAGNMLIRAEGKLKEAMIIVSSGAVLNIFLNPVFIVWLKMGIQGAALATVISMCLLSVFNLIYFSSGRVSYAIQVQKLYFDLKMLKPILSVGVSAMMLQLMFFVQQVVVFKSLAHYGKDWDIAFMGACYRVIVLLVMPVFGFAQALQPVAGINFGAKRYDRVRKAFNTFTWSGTILMSAIWLLLMLFPASILSWMIPDTLFAADDLWNFRMFLLTVPLFPVFFMGTTLFQAIGMAKHALVLQLSRELLLFVPLLLILPLFYGVNGIYFSGVPVNIVLVLATILMVSWQLNKTKATMNNPTIAVKSEPTK